MCVVVVAVCVAFFSSFFFVVTEGKSVSTKKKIYMGERRKRDYRASNATRLGEHRGHDNVSLV